MKKSFSILAFALVAALGFTACHEDDDEENSSTVANYSQSATMGASVINNVSTKAGVTTCYFTDDSQIADFYTFSTMPVDTISMYGNLNAGFTGSTLALDKSGLQYYGENAYYGGFCPTWYDANDEDQTYLPACRAYHNSNTGALICNPGTACRTLFSRHMAVDLTSVMAAIKKLKISSLWVCPVEAYNYLDTARTDCRWEGGYDLKVLPKNHEIQFVVYGYVEHCSISNFKTAVETLRNAAKGMASGGKMCEAPAVLASTDENGVLTINADWQRLDLSSIKDCYLLEAAIRVVDKSTGKTSTQYSIDSDSNEDLNYVLVSDVHFSGRSFF